MKTIRQSWICKIVLLENKFLIFCIQQLYKPMQISLASSQTDLILSRLDFFTATLAIFLHFIIYFFGRFEFVTTQTAYKQHCFQSIMNRCCKNY